MGLTVENSSGNRCHSNRRSALPNALGAFPCLTRRSPKSFTTAEFESWPAKGLSLGVSRPREAGEREGHHSNEVERVIPRNTMRDKGLQLS